MAVASSLFHKELNFVPSGSSVESFVSPLDQLSPFDYIFDTADALGSILHEALEQAHPLAFDWTGSIHVWEEIELDEEINSLEEEIARIEEQKRALKTSNLPGSTEDTDEISFKINLDFLASSPFRHFLPSEEPNQQQQQEEPQQQRLKHRKSLHSSLQGVKKRSNHNTKKRTPKKVAHSMPPTHSYHFLDQTFCKEQILKIHRLADDEQEEVDIL